LHVSAIDHFRLYETAMTTDDSKAITHRGAILFPHTFLALADRDRVLAVFDELTICQPWYMDDSVIADPDNRIHVGRPPEALMPPKDFKKLLAEYRTWVRQNPGHTFLPPAREEDATWEIRASLRYGDKPVRSPAQGRALRWHLILHLERELEESRMAADDMLLHIKAEQSPLAEALGEATPLQGLLDDLPVSEPPPGMDNPRLKQVVRAWFGLFGSSIPGNGILITRNHEILSYTEELLGTTAVLSHVAGGASSFPAIQVPVSSDIRQMKRDPVVAGFSGKTLVLIDQG
jgi:hypothetical protein